jgi:ubiquinol-cytochrome c reductase cytochrome b subunit
VVGRPDLETDVVSAAPVTRRLVGWLDSRTGSAPLLRRSLRYLFPDHWSFLLGEVALYAFVVLVATGTYLAFFFVDSTHQIVYHGTYTPLRGQHMSEAYASVLEISFSVRAGLLIRQTHHWAANVFIAAIVLHLFRVFFTGAYRKPRTLTYLVGVTILTVSLLEAYIGYSLVDDLLSGMGLVIGYSVGLAVPFVGANLMNLVFQGPFPGGSSLWPRMYLAHVLLFPALIATLLAVHLALVAARHHTQFRRRRKQTERTLVGVPMWPGQAPRSVGLALAVAGVLFLLGGLAEINPIWLWGPYHTYVSTNGAQPDWYLGWLIGALRIVPGFDWVVGRYTIAPAPFWGGVLFPLVVFAFVLLWPALERRFTRDHGFHNLLDRPRDAPVRTGAGVAMITWVFVVFLAGSSDRADVTFGIPYTGQVWAYRILALVLPPLAGVVAYRACRELQAGDRVARVRHRAEAEARLAGMRKRNLPPASG